MLSLARTCEASPAQVGRGRFAPWRVAQAHALSHRWGDLYLHPILDCPEGIAFVPIGQAQAWGLDPEEATDIGLTNLIKHRDMWKGARVMKVVEPMKPYLGPFYTIAGIDPNYGATISLLVPAVRERVPIPLDRQLVIVPDRSRALFVQMTDDPVGMAVIRCLAQPAFREKPLPGQPSGIPLDQRKTPGTTSRRHDTVRPAHRGRYQTRKTILTKSCSRLY